MTWITSLQRRFLVLGPFNPTSLRKLKSFILLSVGLTFSLGLALEPSTPKAPWVFLSTVPRRPPTSGVVINGRPLGISGTAGRGSHMWLCPPYWSFWYRYIWLPGNVNDDIGEFKVEWHDLYSIDTKTGAVAFPEGTTYEAEDGQWTGSASVTVCVSLSSF